ncbi:DUF2271 domain-containing protein [Mesonia sp. MT50]|uniref:DUF2271 domain-containing protein n=1 Tax=Mesonia profundi TaxID=3070998 RepID=A0ABU1A0J1_9FLAO|nr:DUF2271 domain-containing protein [Mesonia profundi]MDQ7917191.1 DUF2271 domain-containing protein [Mesonia profundi]
MKKAALVLGMAIFGLMAFTTPPTDNYKCLVQLKNYEGEGAYVVVSLLDEKGEYVETLQVMGDDPEWYKDITQWYAHFQQKEEKIDGITGATISGGQRAIKVIEIPSDKIDAGYSIRFETAVEDQDYHASDLQFELNAANLKAKQEGTGYIRYVRMLKQ